jgi:hypothetical protein
VVTADNLTAEQINDARDRWPQHITSAMAANALGLPESHTAGGLPNYCPPRWQWHARQSIAMLINNRREQCPGRAHHAHAQVTCNADCCTECGGPIDENDECRCEGQRDFPPGEHPARYGAS